jgi:hypothetical protein
VKCIKSDCQYYHKHDFNESWRVCYIVDRNMKHDLECECFIESEIESLKRRLKRLEYEFGYIKLVNNNKELIR